jgi:hypothetical protein
MVASSFMYEDEIKVAPWGKLATAIASYSKQCISLGLVCNCFVKEFT